MSYRIVRTALAVCCLWLATAPAALPAGKPDATTPDGGRYFGPLVEGKLHGRGRMEWDNGAVYEGGFANGLMSGRGRYEFPEHIVYEGEFRRGSFWGQGEARHHDGRIYRGEFVRGDYHGKGRLENRNGDVYEGDFSKSDFTGTGRYTRKDGAHYEGQFKSWEFHGTGRYDDGSGNVYEGTFSKGQLQGRGKATGHRGTYEGDFKDWRFHGNGVMRLANGDVYRGSFENGFYEGDGTLTYAKPKPDGRKQDSGLWRFGMLPQETERKQTKTNVEAALYSQKALLDKALASVKPRVPGRINLYLLSVAGDGSQEVFRREVEFVQAEFARRFDTTGRTVTLINSRNTVNNAPMATVTSLREAIRTISARMDREEDILFLFLTSHGSREHELTLNQNGMELQGLRASELGALLKESGIRWKVVVVSACYSGGFVDALKDERMLFIAAARRDRRSFGCADENDFTYFGRAFFKEALPASGSFHEAFRKAEALVAQWETKDASGAAGNVGGKTAEENRSLPQISSAPAIDAHLKRWWAQSSR